MAQIESARNFDSACAETPLPGRLTQRLTAPSTRPTSPNASGSAIEASPPDLSAAVWNLAWSWRPIALRVPVTTREPVACRVEPVPRK